MSHNAHSEHKSFSKKFKVKQSMPTCKILDTIPAFLSIWSEVSKDEVNKQIDAWLDRYMSQWPELLRKQTDYFLGRESIARLQERMSLRGVALLNDIEGHLRPLLNQMAG